MSNNRIEYVDLAKGVCLTFVLFEHVTKNVPGAFDPFVDMMGRIDIFAMPCFSLLSGLFARKVSFREFFARKWRLLLLPLVVMYAISVLVAWLASSYAPTVIKNEFDVWALFKSQTFTNGPIWFLSAIFFTLFVAQLLFRVGNVYLQDLLAVVLSAVGIYWGQMFDWRLPLYWDSALSGLAFLWLGVQMRPWLDRFDNRRLCALLGVAMLTVFALLPEVDVSMIGNNYSGYVAVLVASIGALGLLLLCKSIGRLPVFDLIGRNTLLILCLHMYVIIALSFALKLVHLDGVVCGLVCFVLIVGLMVLLSKYGRRYIPLLDRLF